MRTDFLVGFWLVLMYVGMALGLLVGPFVALILAGWHFIRGSPEELGVIHDNEEEV